MNDGNTPVNFSNLSLTNPAILSFANGTGANATLQPGEALTLKINISTLSPDSIFELLNFDTDIPNSFTYHVPIFANFYQLPLATKNLIQQKPEMQLIPNPSFGNLKINYRLNASERGHFIIFDMLGNIVYSKDLLQYEKVLEINLTDVSKGIYTCQLQSDYGIEFKKLVLVK